MVADVLHLTREHPSVSSWGQGDDLYGTGYLFVDVVFFVGGLSSFSCLTTRVT